MGEAHLAATLSCSPLLDPVFRGKNSGVNVGDHERSISQTLKFGSTGCLLLCVDSTQAVYYRNCGIIIEKS